MNYLADPGGRFASDTHRRVLGHLSYPTDRYGWSTDALVGRMLPDVGTSVRTPEEMAQLLSDLEMEGLAGRIKMPDGTEVWRMTDKGLEVLTGPISEEPGPDAGEAQPAVVGMGATPIEDGPTEIGENGAADTPTE